MMFPVRVAILSVLLALPFSGEAGAASRSLDLEVPVSGITWVREGDSVRPLLPGSVRAGVPGRPDLPVLAVPIAPPEGFRLAAVREVSATWKPLGVPGSLGVFDAPRAVPANGSAAPLPLAALGAGGYLRGQRLDGVVVAPIQPDGRGGWRVASALRLELTFEEDRGEPLVPERGPRGFEFMAPPGNLRDFRNSVDQDRIHGPEKPARSMLAAPSEPFSPRFRPSLDGSPVSYLIITSEQLAPEFEALASWRTRTGFPAVVRTVEWIEENYPDGADIQERIRSFIQDAVRLWGTEWVLMGGDDPVLPVRYGRTSFFGGERIPTDMYFQCLDGNWNENGNDLYGEGRRDEARPGDRADLFPDVWMGRLPAANRDQARVMVQKVLRYEQSPPRTATYPGAALVLAEVISPAAWIPGTVPIWDGAELAEDVVDILSPHLSIKKLYENHTAWEDALPETLTTVIQELNRGYGLVHHVGHGFYDNMSVGLGGDSQAFKIPNADGLVNGPSQSVLYAINCTSAAVDFDSIVEHLMYNPNGGILAAVGSTRFDFPGTSEVYDLEYYTNVFEKGMDRIGEASAQSKVPFAVLSTTDNAHRWTQFTLIALADPAMRIYTSTPGDLQVSHPESFPLGTAAVEFSVQSSGAPLANARVTCYREGELLVWGETGLDGTVTLSLSPETTGSIGVVVTASNHVALATGGIEVTAPGGPYPVLAATTISDESVGGNDRLEAGEQGEVVFTLRNAGAVSLTGLTVSASVEAEAVILGSGSGGPGALAPAVEGDYPFSVTIDPGAPDLLVAPVTLSVQSNEGNWTLSGVLYVGAPQLDVYDLEVIETSGNGDGDPDPGESVTLIPRIFNRGAGGSAPLLATLDLLDPQGALLLDDQLDLGILDPGGMNTGSSGFSVQLGSGSDLPRFLLRVEDAPGESPPGGVLTERLSRALDLLPPDPPVNVIAAGGPKSITVSWDSSGSGDILRYVIEVAPEESGPFSRISPFNSYPTSRFVDQPLLSLVPRFYRVASQDSSGNLSAFSDPARGIPLVFLVDGFPVRSAIGTVTSPLVTDLDGDLVPDIVTGGDQVYAFHADGSELRDGDDDPLTRGVWATITQPSGVWAPPSVGDLDGDGRKEVVAVSFREGVVYAWDQDGNIRPGFPRPTASGSGLNVYAAPVLADLTGDGRLEIVVQAFRAIYVFDRFGNELLDGDANPATQGVFFVTNSAFSYGTPAAADLDGDARDELVIPTRAGVLHVLDDDGSPMPGYPIRFGGFITSSPAIADLDDDGSYEIVFGTGADSLEVRRTDGSVFPGWPKSLLMNADLQSSPAVGDVDGDGDLEIAVVSGNTTVYLWHHDGTLFDGFPVKPLDDQGNPMAARGSIALGNLDEDHDLELAFANQSGLVFGMDLDGSVLPGYPVRVGAAVEGGVMVADVDGDGFNELALSCLDSQSYLYRTAGRAVVSDWSMFRHDPRRTGRVDAPLDDADLPRLRVSVPENLDAALGSPLVVPVTLDNNVPVGRLEFVLRFDPGVLSLQGVAAGVRAGGLTLASDPSVAGEVLVSLDGLAGGPELEAGTGEIATVSFTVSGGGASSGLDLRSLAARSPGDRALPIGAESGSVTSVRGVSLAAEGTAQGARLRWTALADAGHLGFRVLRARDEVSEPSPVHEGLLGPEVREFLDTTALPGARYGYTLEALDRGGQVQRFGPVEIRLPASVLQAGVPYPNPMRSGVSLDFRGGGNVEAVVIDASGRRVRSLEPAGEGAGRVEWDGHLETGGEAPAGIYFLHLRHGGTSVTRRVVKLGS